LLYKINITIYENLTCTSQSCTLKYACDNYDTLWAYSFKVQFENDPSNYLILPIGTFAVNVGGNCELFI